MSERPKSAPIPFSELFTGTRAPALHEAGSFTARYFHRDPELMQTEEGRASEDARLKIYEEHMGRYRRALETLERCGTTSGTHWSQSWGKKVREEQAGKTVAEAQL